VITGVPVNGEALAALAQQLKKLCGTGGTVKDGVIEIQGDHCDKIQAKLSEMGYKVKRAGG
jgi:translation initiation factor 1